ncbi:SDR family NAD(P)-dependent oxidoreductase [Pararobbsia silviterrae]|uniref:SDR family NAD(P)-dependent oxidoreductase n=1 Tax=Pararobbsia silviterrae TaxID=1792498 RepID=A0A494XQ94_9BURK|nr:SDR family NAD(P)-dependent oxidoreductase [Pararobbsia silviterrae]RKP51982.1 SDR family NAD(P)-dependent oxidoreductase [Pararobbsia silviterrae]
MAPIRLDGQVAIVTGAGGGLGRCHALELARRGAKVVVNDLGVTRDGLTQTSDAAEAVVREIEALGGEAVANATSVTDTASVRHMVEETLARWGRIDILVNNAGFLRDKSFSNMSLDDFEAIVDVHLMGAVRCTKAVWDIMRSQKYGRIVFTTSSSGLFGNFGQANYSAAKMGLVGLMQTLAIEGLKYGIRVNCLAPSAATRMTEELFPAEDLALLTPQSVTPGVIYLVSPEAPTKTILCAGAGAFASSHVTLTEGIYAGDGPAAAETLLRDAGALIDRRDEQVPSTGFEQSKREILRARAARRDLAPTA